MDDNKIADLLLQLSAAEGIKLSDIPDIDLYMDQVTTFMDRKLETEKRDKKDKLLTKTMINNYSKAKILTPSKNKRYNKHQMVQLILIYYLKQVLSISDIHALFTPMFQLAESNEVLIDELYNTYLKIKKDMMEHVHTTLQEKSQLISQSVSELKENEKDKAQLLLDVLFLASQAQAYKRAAEAMIDQYFKTAD
jgi:DNA-binding transcriptional MerR regulator